MRSFFTAKFLKLPEEKSINFQDFYGERPPCYFEDDLKATVLAAETSEKGWEIIQAWSQFSELKQQMLGLIDRIKTWCKIAGMSEVELQVWELLEENLFDTKYLTHKKACLYFSEGKRVLESIASNLQASTISNMEVESSHVVEESESSNEKALKEKEQQIEALKSFATDVLLVENKLYCSDGVFTHLTDLKLALDFSWASKFLQVRLEYVRSLAAPFVNKHFPRIAPADRLHAVNALTNYCSTDVAVTTIEDSLAPRRLSLDLLNRFRSIVLRKFAGVNLVRSLGVKLAATLPEEYSYAALTALSRPG